jgi:hypothetical protein
MLLERIQRDLFDFTAGEDPDDFGPLLNFWYRANTPALSAALVTHPGLKIVVDAPSIRSLERMTQKLFLLADTIVLRGLSEAPAATQKPYRAEYLTPIADYRPGYLNDIIDELQSLHPSPLTLLKGHPIWTSTTKTLRSGSPAAYAVDMQGGTPADIINWIGGPARPLLESGRLVYAPFVPSLEMEREFLRNRVDLSAYFNTSPCFHHNLDWLTAQQLDVLFSLQIPFLDGIDLDTLGRVKQDHRDAFESFSRLMLDALNTVKSSIDTGQFAADVRNVQRNLIDAGLSDVDKTYKKLTAMSSLRKKGMLVGLVGLNAAAFLGLPQMAIVSGLAAAGVKMVADKIDELKEANQLRELKNYFLWKLRGSAQP